MSRHTLIRQVGVVRHHGIRTLHVRIIIEPPEGNPDLPRRVKQASPNIVHHNSCTHGHADSFYRFYYSVDDVGAGLEQIWEKKVQQVNHCVFASQTNHPQSNVLDDTSCGLAMHLVSVDQCILQKWCNGVHIILGHLADILEEKGEGLQYSILDVELWNAVFIHQRRQDGEWCTRFCDDTDCNSCADA